MKLRLGDIIVVVLIGLVSPLLGQSPEAIRHCKMENFKADFYILTKEKKIRYKDTLSYTWFKSQKIHTTQGNSAGDLLHGTYTKYYHSGQLAEQGDYKYGLKDGTWFTWYESGKTCSIKHYRNGVLHGKVTHVANDGTLISESKYRRGRKKIKRSKDESDEMKEEPKDNLFGRLFKKDTEEDLSQKEEEDNEEKRKETDEKEPIFQRIFGKKEKNKEKKTNRDQD